jgi:hypothetical protein
MLTPPCHQRRAALIKEGTMNTNANANTNKSGMSEICELTDDELDAVNGMLLTTGGNGPIEFSVTIAEAN